MAKMLRARYRVEKDHTCGYGCCDNRLPKQEAKQLARRHEQRELRATVREETE